jgi:glutamate-1-semialdehyde aminotransferase/spore coat polysaccharide biosynthesis protein SpsF (cytidylyltransferase family)
MKVVAIVQARMSSRRLAGKVLLDIGGVPMLGRVVQRLGRATSVDEVVVATSDAEADDPVARFCVSGGINVVRGSEEDVLDRFHQVAEATGADIVVRVTADCPLLDPLTVDLAVATLREQAADYVATRHPPYPDGTDVEAFSREVLDRAWSEATTAVDREHVTTFLRRAPDIRRATIDDAPPLPPGGDRWTVDEPRDLDFVRTIYQRVDDYAGLSEIADLLWRSPDLTQINAGIARNEGLYRSIAEEPPLPAVELTLDRSRAIAEQSARLIPSGTQTFSKGPTQFVGGVAPMFLESGRGSHVWDVDGNEFIDYAMGLGPVILGHAHEGVDTAVIDQARRGLAFSLPHPLEVEVAQLVVDTIPSGEMVRFGKNGSDVTSGAVRAARALTGRSIVACCGYHGWQDWFIGTTTRSLGVPPEVAALTIPFVYNDLPSLERIFEAHPGQVAAVIMEPVGVEAPDPGFLEGVRALASAEGALLVFDEVITGFRLALGGAQELFGVLPDLTCVGKAMANGYPVSAVTGRAEVMEIFDEIFFSFTFGGEAVSLAAAAATMAVLREPETIPHLWAQGQTLRDGYNTLAHHFELAETTSCIGLAPRTVITFTKTSGYEPLVLKSLFQQECVRRGVLFTGGQNVCLAHSDADVEHTLRVYRSALEVLRRALDEDDLETRLEGDPVQPVFRAP